MTGKTIATGYVYYAQSHQRQLVEISEQLRQDAIATIEKVGALWRSGNIPLPVYTARCTGCSLFPQCLPQAAAKVNRYQEAS